MEKKYYPEINIARGIAVLFVLLGHSFPDAQTGFAYKECNWVFDFCYAFHMGLFFILSGFVSSARLYEADYKIKDEMIKKVKRLMVPYAVYSILTLALKLLFQEYANNKFGLKDIWTILLGKNPNGGLWYLWNLFMISLIMLLVCRVIGRLGDTTKSIIMIVLGLAFYICSECFSFTYVDRLFQYIIFYNAGIVLAHYYEKIKDKLFYMLPAITGMFIVFVAKCPYLDIPSLYFWTAILGSYGILTFAIFIAKNKESKLFKLFSWTGDYSYDIYMLSYFVQVPIRVVCWRILKLPYSIDVVLMFAGGLVIPCLISQFIIRKNSLLKKVLIGDWK